MKWIPPFHTDPTATATFPELRVSLDDADAPLADENLKAVVIGGGTGAPMSIRTLLSLGVTTNAIVAMADDGGSTGILREEADVTPPGDVRKCLSAFARNPENPLVKVFKYRFAVARDHALGNLLLSALEDTCGSFPAAVAICEELLEAQGHVYPSTLDKVYLSARTRDGRWLESQAEASHSRTALESVSLRCESGEIQAYEPALRAIAEADLVVLGPGSLFTSIMANLLVPGIIETIRSSKAAVLFICSLADNQGETWGLTAQEHWEALNQCGMEGLIHYMLVHSPTALKAQSIHAESYKGAQTSSGVNDLTDEGVDGFYLGRTGEGSRIRPVEITYESMMTMQDQGTLVLVRDLADEQHPTWHSPEMLRAALTDVFKLARARKRAMGKS